MVERICPECRTDNAIDDETCRACGAKLELPLTRTPDTRLASRTAGTALSRYVDAVPIRWQRAGKAAALGAVALAVEVGAAWLQQRANNRPAPLARTDASPVASPRVRGSVTRHRVWETFENGTMTRRVVEQTVWHLDD